MDEDRRLSFMEYSSVGVFVIGLGLSLVYFEKWGIARALGADQDDESAESVS